MKEKLLLYLFLTLGLMSMKAGDTTSITIKGYVKDATGKGIKGVVVNNGTNFTITDKKGAWTLPTDTLVSKFISISTPANYTLPAVNGIARGFYKTVRTAMKAEQNVFVLNKREKPVTSFHYIAISDPQLRTTSDLKRWTTETVKDAGTTGTRTADAATTTDVNENNGIMGNEKSNECKTDEHA